MMTFLKRLFMTTVLMLIGINSLYALGCVAWQQGTFTPKTNSQGQKLPAYGLYWYKADGSTNAHESAMKACSYGDPKFRQQELANGYFDPKKPTVIFIHGWQPNTIHDKHRFDFCYQYKTDKHNMSQVYNTLAAWKGYNVAVFYWNQFADDGLYAAEAKIYSTHGSHGMKWVYDDSTGTLQTCQAGDASCVVPNEDITDLAFDAYQQALPKLYHNNIRIAGQSLGAQVAIQLTAKIMQHPLMPQPTRLALLDPYFSTDGLYTAQNNLPHSVADYNTDTVKQILATYAKRHPLVQNHKFPIAVYRTSKVSYAPLGNPAWNMMNLVSYTRIYPVYLNKGLGIAKQPQAKHEASVFLYMGSKAYAPKYPLGKSSNFNYMYVNADATIAQVTKLMGQKRYQQIKQLNSNTVQNYASDTWLSEFLNVKPKWLNK